MPLPVDYGTGIVTGTFTDTNGDPVVGTISFTPSASRLLGTGAVILGDAVVVDLDATGSLSVTLPASDDPHVNPTDFTYRVDETFVGTVGSTYFIDVLEGTTLDLSDVAVPGVVNNGTVILDPGSAPEPLLMHNSFRRVDDGTAAGDTNGQGLLGSVALSDLSVTFPLFYQAADVDTGVFRLASGSPHSASLLVSDPTLGTALDGRGGVMLAGFDAATVPSECDGDVIVSILVSNSIYSGYGIRVVTVYDGVSAVESTVSIGTVTVEGWISTLDTQILPAPAAAGDTMELRIAGSSSATITGYWNGIAVVTATNSTTAPSTLSVAGVAITNDAVTNHAKWLPGVTDMWLTDGEAWWPGSLPGAASAGDVVGPASVTTSRVALFDGTTGKLIKQASGGYNATDIGAAAAAITISAGTGLTGGGDLSSSRTLAIDTATTVDKTTAQTLTNKTLTAPAISSPTGLVKGDVGLGNVTNDAQIAKSIGTAKGDSIGFTASATPTNVAVGSDGKVQVADTNSATGKLWAVPAQTHLFGSGLYTAASYPSSAATHTASRLHYLPFHVARRLTFDRIAINHTATTSTTGGYRLGIYGTASSGAAPGSLIVDCGVAPTDTAAGVKEITISQALDPGLYWLAAVSQITGAAPSVTATGLAIATQIPTSSPTTSVANYPYEAGVSGALPSTAAPSAYVASPPLVFLRTA